MPDSTTESLPVLQDLAGCVVPGNARDSTARVCRRSTLVEAMNGSAVIRIVWRRPLEEELLEREFAVEDVSLRRTDDAFDVRRQQQLLADDAVAEAGCELIDRRVDVLEEAGAFGVPRRFLQFIWRMAAKQVHDMLSGWREGVVDSRRDDGRHERMT